MVINESISNIIREKRLPYDFIIFPNFVLSSSCIRFVCFGCSVCLIPSPLSTGSWFSPSTILGSFWFSSPSGFFSDFSDFTDFATFFFADGGLSDVPYSSSPVILGSIYTDTVPLNMT